jgi:hypothetical protein
MQAAIPVRAAKFSDMAPGALIRMVLGRTTHLAIKCQPEPDRIDKDAFLLLRPTDSDAPKLMTGSLPRAIDAFEIVDVRIQASPDDLEIGKQIEPGDLTVVDGRAFVCARAGLGSVGVDVTGGDIVTRQHAPAAFGKWEIVRMIDGEPGPRIFSWPPPTVSVIPA